MNALNTKLTALLLTLLTACASASDPWHADGRIQLTDGREVRTKLTGVHIGAVTDFGIFIAGYIIEPDGTNLPHIALIDARNGRLRYWQQDYPVLQFFKFRDQWLAVAADGQVWRFSPAEHSPHWAATTLKFGQDARVLQNGHGDTVACHPAAVEKSQHRPGGCQSLNHGWQLAADWLAPAPVLCEQHLLLLTGLGERRRLMVVQATDGTVTRLAAWLSQSDPQCADAQAPELSGDEVNSK